MAKDQNKIDVAKEAFKTPLQKLKNIKILGKRMSTGGSQNVFVEGIKHSIPLMEVLAELNSRDVDIEDIEELLE